MIASASNCFSLHTTPPTRFPYDYKISYATIEMDFSSSVQYAVADRGDYAGQLVRADVRPGVDKYIFTSRHARPMP